MFYINEFPEISRHWGVIWNSLNELHVLKSYYNTILSRQIYFSAFIYNLFHENSKTQFFSHIKPYTSHFLGTSLVIAILQTAIMEIAFNVINTSLALNRLSNYMLGFMTAL